jgi:hypothetical protein
LHDPLPYVFARLIPSCFRFRLRGSARLLHPSAKTGAKLGK